MPRISDCWLSVRFGGDVGEKLLVLARFLINVFGANLLWLLIGEEEQISRHPTRLVIEGESSTSIAVRCSI